MGKKILLTISIMVSRNKDAAEKCFQSLEKLRKNVPSELIVVDTGCDDLTRKVVEQYADKIVEFEWCGDFAKARNAGVKEARGEWFLYLDDDEWFEDTADIELFFKKNLHHTYNYVYYYQRNYHMKTGNVYEDAPVGRMVKVTKELKFIHKIHECFHPVYAPILQLNSFVHHYGYIFKDRAALVEHSKRNLIPLIEEHESDPSELRHNVQLMQEYNVLHEYDKSALIAEVGIKDFKQGKSKPIHLDALLVNTVVCDFRRERFDDVITKGISILEKYEVNLLAKAYINGMLGGAYCELKQYENSLTYLKEYFKLYQRFQHSPEDFTEYMFITTLHCFQRRILGQMINYGINASYHTHNALQAREYFDYLPLKDEVLIFNFDIIANIVEGLVSDGIQDKEQYLYMCNKLQSRVELLPEIVKELKKQEHKNPVAFMDALEFLNRIEGKNIYLSYLRYLYNRDMDSAEVMQEQPEETKSLFVEFWSDLALGLSHIGFERLWEMTEENGIKQFDIISSIPLSTWTELTNYICKNNGMDTLCEIDMKFEEALEQDSLQFNIWKNQFRLKELLEEIKTETQSGEHFFSKIEQYAKGILVVNRRIYREEIFENMPTALPKDCQISLILESVLTLMEQKDLTQAVRKLSDIRKLDEQFDGILKVLANEISIRQEKMDREQEAVLDEMTQLRLHIKQNVRVMIQAGKKTEAEAVLQQLIVMAGTDVEIEALLSKCRV